MGLGDKAGGCPEPAREDEDGRGSGPMLKEPPASRRHACDDEDDEYPEPALAPGLVPLPLTPKRGWAAKDKAGRKGRVPAGPRGWQLEVEALKAALPRSKMSGVKKAPSEKRKRGRPPKGEPSDEPPRKRGRPRKAVLSPGLPRKRGRPPKGAPSPGLPYAPPKGTPSTESSAGLPRKRGRPPKSTSSAEVSALLPGKREQPPKGTPGAELRAGLPGKRGRPRKGTPSAELSARLPRKRGRPRKGALSAELSTGLPRKRGRPPKGVPSAELSAGLPRKRGRPPKGTLSAGLPRKRGRPPKPRCVPVLPSTELPRKWGRPPKIKSLEQLIQGEAQLPSVTPASQIRKLETKASGLLSPERGAGGSESSFPLEKRKQGRPAKVHWSQVTTANDLQHQSSKNKSLEISKGDAQPLPGTPKPHVVKPETKMSEPSSPRSRTTEKPGEGETQTSPSTPKPRAQKAETSASEPTSSKSKTVSSENDSLLEKRRRGRPPKAPCVPASSGTELARKRGRPPKNPVLPHVEVTALYSGSASDRDTSAENEPPLLGRKRRRRSRKEEPVQAVSESSLDSEDLVALLPPQNATPEVESDGTSVGETSGTEHPPARSTRSMGAVNSSKMGPISGSLRM